MMRRSISLMSLGFVWVTCCSACLANGFDQAIDAALPRVVKLYGLGVGDQVGYGSGVIVSSDGLVLTVFSLLIDSGRLRIVTSDGYYFGGEVIHRDARRQLALLRMRPMSEEERPRTLMGRPGGRVDALPYFDLRFPSELPGERPEAQPSKGPELLRPGDWVIAAGNFFKVAEGGEPVSLAHGIFSTRTRLDARRRVKDFPYHGDVLVIDAITSNPGSPGGAVVNLDGELVGVIGRVVTSNLTHTHLNYAVPRDVLQQFMDEAMGAAKGASDELAGHVGSSSVVAGERDAVSVDPGIRLVRTGYVSLPPMVDRVQRDSPADRAGVRKDDLILSINGRSVSDVSEYDRRLARIAPSEPIELVLRRGRRVLQVHIKPSTDENSAAKEVIEHNDPR